MSEKAWELTNFSALIHQEPAKTSRPDVYANDSVNLRVNREGELVTRYGTTILYDIGAEVVGLVTIERGSDNIILYLTAADDLGIVLGSPPLPGATPTTLLNDAQFQTELSAVLVTNDVIVVTSDGAEQGYWLSLIHI